MTTERDVWHETSLSSEGISVTTYSQAADGEPIVEDETWLTWDEVAESEEAAALPVLNAMREDADLDSDRYADISQTIHYLKNRLA